MAQPKGAKSSSELSTPSLLALVVLVVAIHRLVVTTHPPTPWPMVLGVLGLAGVGALVGVQVRSVPVMAALTVALAAQVLIVFGEVWLWGDGSLRGQTSTILITTLFGTVWRGLAIAVAAMVTQAVIRRSWADDASATA